MGFIPEMPNDFDFSDEEMESEVQLGILEQEKIRILEIIKKQADETIQNIRLKLPGEEKANFRVISRYVSAIVELNTLENADDLSDEEIMERIKSIDDSVKEINFSDLIKYSQDEDDFSKGSLLMDIDDNKKKNDEGSGDSSLDF